MQKICYLPTWEKFDSELKKILIETNLDSKNVIIRLCARKNLQKIIESGTDRDKNSSIWVHPGDANHESKKINPEKIFYGWTLDTTQNPFKTVDCSIANNNDPFYINRIPDTFSNKISPGQIVTLYDSSKVQRKSTFEYAFLDEPKTALIKVFALQKDIEEPEISYYFDD